MRASARALGLIGVAALLSALIVGCGKKDPLEEAAPPPSSTAVQEPTVKKNMPGPNGPTGMGGQQGPGVNAGGMQGAAVRPPGM